MTNPALIQLQGVSRSVPIPGGSPLKLLDSIDLTVRAREILAITGTSGSGKSTLLATLGLLTPPDSGTIELLGRDTTRASDRALSKLRNAHIGFVFQSYSLIRHLTAYENVELPLLLGPARSRKNRKERVLALLDAVGLADRRKSHPRQLSGGEQQRVAIARSLVVGPDLILADEPTGALDEGTADSVLSSLIGVTRTEGCALILVTHDSKVASRATRLLRLSSGRLSEANA